MHLVTNLRSTDSVRSTANKWLSLAHCRHLPRVISLWLVLIRCKHLQFNIYYFRPTCVNSRFASWLACALCNFTISCNPFSMKTLFKYSSVRLFIGKKSIKRFSNEPFFNVAINDGVPFSCFNVTNTSIRNSKATPSFVKCSLFVNTVNTVGGTLPFPVKRNK